MSGHSGSAKPKVFISWSMPRAGGVAKGFKALLDMVLPEYEAFLSSDIPSGTDWWPKLRQSLEDPTTGVVFLTPENRENPWLNFEAGALANSPAGKVMPILCFGLEETSLGPPMSAFQARRCDRDGIERLLCDLNEAVERERRRDKAHVEKQVKAFWKDFEEALEAANLQPRQRSRPRRRRALTICSRKCCFTRGKSAGGSVGRPMTRDGRRAGGAGNASSPQRQSRCRKMKWTLSDA